MEYEEDWFGGGVKSWFLAAGKGVHVVKIGARDQMI